MTDTVADQHEHTEHFYPWSEVKAERRGGPPPRCTFCGEPAPSRRDAANDAAEPPTEPGDRA